MRSDDVCEIGRIEECIEKGHDPLTMPGNEIGDVEVFHPESGVVFARTMFCRRCGLLYWEPKKP